MEDLDAIDLDIVRHLQRDARKPQAEIAKAVGLTVSSAHERIKKLERKGVISGYAALVDAEKLGKPLLAFIRLTVDGRPGLSPGDSGKALSELCRTEPDILECHHVAGEDCYVLKVRAADPKGLERLLGGILERISISRSVTSLVFSTIKETVQVEPRTGA